MHKIVWSETFSVGVAELDGHHQHLAELINQLGDHLQAPGDAAAVDELLTALAAYAAYHFKTEEMLLAECGFPLLEAHQAEHRQFGDTLNEVRYGLTLGLVDLNHLFGYLTRWWCQHILKEDAKYRPFLAAVHA